jgi:hypothetical protein
VDSIPIRAGQKLSDKAKNFIQRAYKGFTSREEIWKMLFGMDTPEPKEVAE